MENHKFSEIFDYLKKSKIKAGQGKEEGLYPLFTSSQKLSKYFDEYIYEGESLIFGTGGLPSIHYINDKFSTSTDCITVQKKKEYQNKVDTGYIYYFFKGSPWILEDGFHGAGLKHISKKYISNIKIPLPDNIDDQIKIANLLSQVEALIAKREESIKLLDELLRSTFLDMFGDPVLNPYNFELKHLDSFFITPKEGTKCGPFGSALKKYEYVKHGVSVWNMDNIDKHGNFIDKAKLFITEEKYTDLQAYSVINGDIIISRAGTVGKMCVVVSRSKNSIISTNLIRLRLDKNKLLPLYFIKLMTYFKNRLKRLEVGADGSLTHMSTKILKSIEFPYPPKPLQDKFATIVQQVEESKKRYQDSLNELHQLFGSLSQRAFKGELDLSEVEIPIIEVVEGDEVLDTPTFMRKVNIDEHIERVDSYTDDSNGPEYSEDFLWMVLSQADDDISYESIASKLEKYSFEEYPNYDRIKSDIFSLIEQKKLKQLFDEDNKSMKLVRAT